MERAASVDETAKVGDNSNRTKEAKAGRPSSYAADTTELEGLDDGQTEAGLAGKRGRVPKGMSDGLWTVPKQ